MHGFAVVAQGFLGEPLGVVHGFCTFSPHVSVALQGDAFDIKLFAAGLEFRRTVAGSPLRQIRKQPPFARQILEQIQRFVAQMSEHGYAGFLAREADGAVLLIHVFALQIRGVALWFFARRHGQLRGLVDAANGAGESVIKTETK